MNSILSEYEKGNPILETGKHPGGPCGNDIGCQASIPAPPPVFLSVLQEVLKLGVVSFSAELVTVLNFLGKEKGLATLQVPEKAENSKERKGFDPVPVRIFF